MLDFTLEGEYDGITCGIDEAGRGPLAGPVVAAAVILNRDCLPKDVNDSKQLTREEREAIFDCLVQTAEIGIGIATVGEIDCYNILRASCIAMGRAFDQLKTKPKFALVDGNQPPKLKCRTIGIVGGDAICLSIAAASIIAKVTRDRLMVELARAYPGYGFEHNAGYGTKFHQRAIRELGLTPEHRTSFAPVRAMLEAVDLFAA